MPYLISVFKIVWYFLLAQQPKIEERRERKSCSNTFPQKAFRNVYLITLAWAWHFQRATQLPTLEGFSIAYVEKHRCLHSKSPITCKVMLPTQSDQLDAVIWAKLFIKKKNCSEILNKVVYSFSGDMTRPAVYPNPRYSEACYNGVLLYYLTELHCIVM
jgi:hypothetical protein